VAKGFERLLLLMLAWAAAGWSPQGPPECSPRGGLPNLFQALKDKPELRIAYLGGSITEQAGWRPKTLEWFRARAPQSKVVEINAAIGGTGSSLGAFRLRHDVLEKKPDLLFIEFAVNDNHEAPEQIVRAFEGILRQTWKENPRTDVCFVYTTCIENLETLRSGKVPPAIETMEKIAEHYRIPSINFGLEVAALEKAGALVYIGKEPKTPEEKKALEGKVLFSPDGYHPYPESGHGIYFEVFRRSIGAIEAAGRPEAHTLPAPLSADPWEAAGIIPLSRTQKSKGWEAVPASTHPWAHARMPELWKASAPGESLRFRFKGTAVGVYDLLGPDCGQVTIRLDDRPPVTVSRFDVFSSYHRLGILTLDFHLRDEIHQVSIAVSPDPPDKAKILRDGHQPPMADPKRFEGAAWYAGGILLVGELVPD
jgi:lysophospholipase L1-like esterase